MKVRGKQVMDQDIDVWAMIEENNQKMREYLEHAEKSMDIPRSTNSMINKAVNKYLMGLVSEFKPENGYCYLVKNLTPETNVCFVHKINETERIFENIELSNVNNEFYTDSAKLENLQAKVNEISTQTFALESQIYVAENVVNDLINKIDSIDQVEMDYNATQAKVGEFNETNKNAYEELKQKRDACGEIQGQEHQRCA